MRPYPHHVLLADLVATSHAVRATSRRRDKVDALAECLTRMPASELGVGARYLAGEPRQHRLGVRRSGIRAALGPPAATATLTLGDVDARLDDIAARHGPGSQAARRRGLAALLGAATADEQRFLVGLLLGELRQGALAGLLVQAIAAAAAVPETSVRRALMLHGDLGAVADAALDGGEEALAAFRLQVGRPIQPMLASTAASVAAAVADLDAALVEHKLDGARVQAHRDGDEVAVYTRSLREVTVQVPEVVRVVAALPAGRLVLDGEALGVGPDGRPEPFQQTMRRLGAEPDADPDPADLDAAGGALPVAPFFFDLLHRDGEDLIDAPLSQRRAALIDLLPPAHRVEGAVCAEAAAAEAVAIAARDAGQEGVVVKDLAAPYQAGRRGKAWRKVKPVHTFDLVVLAVEWGSGRRRGWLSNLHLGARDPAAGRFVMLGKTFKGLTDATLAWQTERFLALEERREGHTVHVRPEQVVEIAVDGVQHSPRYPAGIALRFARVVGYRHDKAAADADTVDAVRALQELA